MSGFDVIIFDLDGTLTNPFLGISRSIKYALDKLGEPSDLPDELIAKFIGPPLADGYEQNLGFPRDKAERAVYIYRERYETIGLNENEAIPGAAETLERLKSRGKRLAVATSKPQGISENVLKTFGMYDFFEVISGADWNVNGRNTKEAVLAHALEQLGVTTDEQRGRCVMVGDRHYDIDGAKAVGIASIGALVGFGSREEFVSAGADFIVEKLLDVVALVD